jgi:hypothetical protein
VGRHSGSANSGNVKTILLNSDGTITYAFVDLDDTKQPEPAELLEVVSTPPQAQFLCWTEGFNTRNITYIPAFESLGPP